MKPPILFIHGFSGGRYEFKPIIIYLSKHGYSRFYEFTYQRKFGQVSIRDIAKELSDYVKANVKEKEIAIIGCSQGGLVAEYYMKHLCNKGVKRLITLCTPHKGTLLAYLWNWPGIKDLRPGSKLIVEMKDFMKYRWCYAVYTPFDLMVFPGWNAIPDNGKAKMSLAVAHPLAFWLPGSLKFVKESLEGRTRVPSSKVILHHTKKERFKY